ncbi:MAG: NAD(P)/FAD-dependent oxidoreductase [Sphingobacteriales bacterium]|nr:NAD(P)/FAD-dependent oxidoreductase [Sphingobacteriales bacterium]MBI3720013.1 NAD(P)/FAD-dependent oxidoreductase [Sphingobacteriales bacterium]
MRKAIIIGAGPAGLTAAYELLKRTGIKPVIVEQSVYAGGLAKTVNYKGNRIDIGGHRFFSKSDRVIEWWLDILPVEKKEADRSLDITYQNKTHHVPDKMVKQHVADGDKVMLVRNRLSRIYFKKQFFPYPIKLSVDTLKKLGWWNTVKIGFSYISSRISPLKPEISLEDFFINRFGKELYLTFFKDYTEKVWGVSCKEISAEWGKQRIKGLSVSKAIGHAVKSMFSSAKDIRQKNTETSLIEQFLYPKLGPGQLWEEVAAKIVAMGGEIHYNQKAAGIITAGNKIVAVKTSNIATGELTQWDGDYCFSTMPVKDFINGINKEVSEELTRVNNGLLYRDFITVGLLVNKLKVKDVSGNAMIKDNWIYIQENEVKLGRLQIFNNWSPFMVSDAGKVWLGLEYFCNVGDELWSKDDKAFIRFAIDELDLIGIINKADVVDATILREEKAYPSYYGSYDQFDILKNYLKQFDNLYPIGRNGMHKYNNSDHSMLTAMTAVDNIVNGITDKENIWQINTEEDYHEEKES